MARGVPPHPRDEVAVTDLQARNQLEDRVETRYPQPALKRAERRALHPNPVGKLLLAQTGLAAEPDQIGREPLAQGPVFLDPFVFLAEFAHLDPSFGSSSSQAIPVSNAQGSTSTAPASFTIVSRRGRRSPLSIRETSVRCRPARSAAPC